MHGVALISAVLLSTVLPGDTSVRPGGPLDPRVIIEQSDRSRPSVEPRSDAKNASTQRGPDRTGWVVLNCVITQDEVDCPDAQPAAAPQITEGDIRRAVSEIPMPSLQIEVQPGERTLVNIPTIFHTDPRTLRESVTLLGFDIDVEARPVRYTWRPGDGSSKTTTKPGRPYPSKDVTHTYRRVADIVRPRVDTTYSVRYRVDGGAWTPLGQTLTATGEPTSLEVEEAAPVLVTP